MHHERYRALLVAAALGGTYALGSCSGPKSALTPPLPQIRADTQDGRKRLADARLVIYVTRKPGVRRHYPRYVSPSTQSLTLSAPGRALQIFNVTAGSPGCSRSGEALTCSVNAALPAGTQTIGVSLYDRLDGQGDVLSTASAAVTVALGRPNRIGITLNGVPVTAKVLLGAPGASAMTVPEGTAVTVPVTVSAYDARNNLIVAPGSYASPVGLTDSDASGATMLSAASASRPAASVTLSYTGAALSSATIVPHVNGVAQTEGSATLTLAAPGVAEYSIPTTNSGPGGITLGPDGALWFAENGGKIGRISTSGTIAETTIGSLREPWAVASGSDGALWFTEFSGGKLGRVTTGGTLSQEYTLPTSNAYPAGIAPGPDGALWFTEEFANKIGQITTAGAVTEYPLPMPANDPTPHPWDIVSGPDGALWFTEAGGNNVGRITTDGATIDEYPVPTADANPAAITVGPDGQLWFTELCGNKIGTIGTNGVVTNEFPIPTASSAPSSIALGSDGALWFTEANANQIGRITTGGTVTEYQIPTANAGPSSIAAGPDDALWFTEYSGNKIGRLPVSIASAHATRITRKKK